MATAIKGHRMDGETIDEVALALVEGHSPVAGPLWDDEAFVFRVREATRIRGMSIESVAQGASVSKAWLTHSTTQGGRAIERILRVAKALDVEPGALMGLHELPAPLPLQQEERRLALMSRLSAQLAAAINDGTTPADAVAVLSMLYASFLTRFAGASR